MKDDKNITFSDINKTSQKPIYVVVLEDLKLKFQEPEVARENQRGEIETLKKQGERFVCCEFIGLSWLFSELVFFGFGLLME